MSLRRTALVATYLSPDQARTALAGLAPADVVGARAGSDKSGRAAVTPRTLTPLAGVSL
jgi:hypothetical protein